MNLNPIDVLLVEDDPADAELTLRALRDRGFANNVKCVGDGAEALHFMFGTGPYVDRNMERVPKLILLDLNLPKVSGLEVLERLKEDERTKNIPVVVMTSSRQEPDIKRCYGLGVNSYVVKPISFENFTDCVADLGLYWLLLNEPPV